MAKGPQINDKPHLAPVTPITEIRTVASRSTPRRPTNAALPTREHLAQISSKSSSRSSSAIATAAAMRSECFSLPAWPARRRGGRPCWEQVDPRRRRCTCGGVEWRATVRITAATAYPACQEAVRHLSNSRDHGDSLSNLPVQARLGTARETASPASHEVPGGGTGCGSRRLLWGP